LIIDATDREEHYMALFNYECLNKQGEIIKGQLNAEDLPDLVNRLKNMGLTVLDVKQAKTGNSFMRFTIEKKVTLGDLSLFSKQLASMISAGIPVTKALFTLSRQVANATLKNALADISKNVEEGMSLTNAFGAYPNIFPGIYASMIESGELGGTLELSLARLSEQLLKEKQLQDNIKSATFYPRLLLGFAAIIFSVMLVFIVPIFQRFIPKGTPVPGITKLIFSMSESARNYWYIWLLVITVIAASVMAYVKSSIGKWVWERVKFKMPVFGTLIQKSVIARFSRTLSMLMASGIPVVQAMQSAGPTSGSLLVANAVTEASKRIEEGKNISVPLEESGIFPPMVTQMIAVGEETGQLPELLEKIADFYEEEVSVMTKGLSSLIEPLMLILIGIIIGGMLISLYLPIFSAITYSY